MYTFLIEDVFELKDGESVVVGNVQGSKISVNDLVNIIPRNHKNITTKIIGIENNQQQVVTEVEAGNIVTLRLEGVSKDQVHKGDVLSNVKDQQQINGDLPLKNPRLSGLMSQKQRPGMEFVTSLIYEEIVMFAHFLSPVLVTGDLKDVEFGQTTIGSNSMIKFPLISSDENHSFYPIFTEWEELNKWKSFPSNKTMIFSFDDYTSMVENSTAVGIVIDPFGDNLLLPKDLISKLKERKESILTGKKVIQPSKEMQVTVGDPKVYPQELIDAMKEYLVSQETIKGAWLRYIVKEDGNHNYLLVLDIDGNDKIKPVEQMVIKVRPLLEGMALEITDLSKAFAVQAIENATPFFIKGEIETDSVNEDEDASKNNSTE